MFGSLVSFTWLLRKPKYSCKQATRVSTGRESGKRDGIFVCHFIQRDLFLKMQKSIEKEVFFSPVCSRLKWKDLFTYIFFNLCMFIYPCIHSFRSAAVMTSLWTDYILLRRASLWYAVLVVERNVCSKSMTKSTKGALHENLRINWNKFLQHCKGLLNSQIYVGLIHGPPCSSRIRMKK